MFCVDPTGQIFPLEGDVTRGVRMLAGAAFARVNRRETRRREFVTSFMVVEDVG
jgi:hypothetical protein